MKFLFSDECNVTYNERLVFFIYGGLIVDEVDIREISKEILSIKREFGLEKGRPVKWSNAKSKKWPPLEPEVHKSLKAALLDLAEKSQIEIIVCLSPQIFYHHFFSRKPAIDPATLLRTQKYATNDCMVKFNAYLREKKSLGCVFADRFPSGMQADMSEHCLDLFPSGGGFVTERIAYPTVQLTDEHSPLHQLNDVVLGAIMHSLKELGHNLFPKIKEKFWRRDPADPASALNYGFTVFPHLPKTDKVLSEREKVLEKFIRLVR